MRPAGVVMVLLFCVCALVLALLQQIQRFLNIGHCALRQSDHLLIDDLEVDRALVEQVIDLLVVDLQVGDIEPSRLALSSGLREDLLQREEDESFGLAVAQHRVGLAGGGLAVHENGGVASLQKLFYHPGAASGIDLCVALGIPEHVIAGELVDVVHFYLALLAGRVLGGLGPERMSGEGGDLLLLLVDAPGLDVLVLVDEGPEPDCNFYLLAALLHLTTNNYAIVQLQLMAEERYVFVVEWFDSAASLVRSYQLTYFLKDRSIEMFDLKNKRIFLKRCEYPQLQLKDIFVGAVLSIYSRQLKVIDFADEFTRTKFEVQRSKALLLVTPDAYLSAGKILNAVEEAGFSLTNLKMARLGRSEAEQVLEAHRGRPYFAELAALLASDLVLALEVLAENCVAKVKDFVGSVRQKFGTDQAHPAIIGSESTASAAKELEIFFSAKSQLQSPAYFTNCSCLVVKPHLVTENYVGQVLDAVLSSGFEVSAAEMFWLDRPSAEEFLEVYKGVVPEYSQLVEELTNGPCIAMEVRQENVVPALRELCGPHDPEMAKTVRPKSLRAVFGRDKGKNGVHCTDLPDDGILEVEYFFNILQKK